jgi:hypothetical protein
LSSTRYGFQQSLTISEEINLWLMALCRIITVDNTYILQRFIATLAAAARSNRQYPTLSIAVAALIAAPRVMIRPPALSQPH